MDEEVERIKRVAAELDAQAKIKAEEHAFEQRVVNKVEAIRSRAMHAAKRLMDARPADGPRPTNTVEFLDMIKSMMRTPKRWGVLLTEPEKRALKTWDKIARVMLAKRAELGTQTKGDRGESA